MEALKTKLKGKTWLVIIIISLFGQVAWAIENNFFNLYIRCTHRFSPLLLLYR